MITKRIFIRGALFTLLSSALCMFSVEGAKKTIKPSKKETKASQGSKQKNQKEKKTKRLIALNKKLDEIKNLTDKVSDSNTKAALKAVYAYLIEFNKPQKKYLKLV